jgi:hypothetical protein
MREMRAAGRTYREIAKVCKVSYQTVMDYLSVAGVDARRKKKRTADESVRSAKPVFSGPEKRNFIIVAVSAENGAQALIEAALSLMGGER